MTAESAEHDTPEESAAAPTPVPVIRLPRAEPLEEAEENVARPRRGWPWLLLVILLGVAVRTWRIDAGEPGAVGFDQLALARGFVEGDADLLHPTVPWSGDTAGYVRTGFPLFAHGLAQLQRTLGDDPRLGPALNVAAYVLAALALYLLARRLFDAGAAVFAVLFFSTAPLVFELSRSFSPALFSALASLCAIAFFWIWIDRGGFLAGLAAALSLSVALAMHGSALSLLPPLVYLVGRELGLGALKRPSLWLFAIVVAAGAAGWHAWALHLWEQHGNTLGDLGLPTALGAFTRGDARWSELGIGLALDLTREAITPAGLLYLAVGVLSGFVARRNAVLFAWTVGILAYVAAVPRHGTTLAAAELLPLALVAAAYMGQGASALLRKGLFSRAATALVVAGVLAGSAWQLWPRLTAPPVENVRAAFAARVAEQTQPEALIVFAAPLADDEHALTGRHRLPSGTRIPGDPRDLHRSRRRGWSLDLDGATPQQVEALAQRGARVFAAFTPEPVRLTPELTETLERLGAAIEITPNWTIYSLAAPAAAQPPAAPANDASEGPPAESGAPDQA